MQWFVDNLNAELFRVSNTPVTWLTLFIIVGVGLVSTLAGPWLRGGLRRLLMRPGGELPASSLTQKRFGTFTGVFTPSILTILGVIMYLRVGWVVGNVGLGGALLIVLIAHLITLATGLSVSSIATNRTVGAGGAYYIISRSLGAPVGAAIGIPLFFGQALSVTFYIVGFTESLKLLVPGLPEQLVSSGVLLLLTLLSLKSTDLALRFQYLIIGAIALSLLSFFSGWNRDVSLAQATSEITWWASDREQFAVVFAVFFPAVTGIMAGVGMSGDLKDPRRSLPRGTLFAILVGFIIYTIFPVWLALNADADTLVQNKTIVWNVARFEILIFVGVWGATMSSALGSILTAPRTLQALAMDGLAPGVFAQGHGATAEPRIGVLATWLLAQGGILMGGLDVIAPVLTMFFLATYGLTNLACGLEKWAASPSFRPSFSVPAVVGLAGGGACIYVMSIINMPAMIAASVFSAMIYIIAQRRVLGTTYGDARHGIWAALVRSALHRLRKTEFHPLNWRPNLIIMGGDHEKRPWLLRLGSAIVQDRGIVTYVQMLTGDIQELAPRRRELAGTLDDRIHEQFPNVFGRVDVVGDKYRGAVTISQSYGVGSLEANTVLLGWPNKSDYREEYLQMLRNLASLDRSLLIVHYNNERKFGRQREIHIWWGGLEANGGLMLLIAYLITAHHEWRNARVMLRTVVEDESHRAEAAAGISEVLSSARVEATPVVLLRDGRRIENIMHSESKDADLVIAGLRLPADSKTSDRFFERINVILENMPTTVLVHSARNFESEPVLFDDAPASAVVTPDQSEAALEEPPADS